MRVYKELMRCKSNQEYTHSPFDSVVNKKMFGFPQVLEPIKWQVLLEKGKNSPIRFEQVQRFVLAKNVFWG